MGGTLCRAGVHGLAKIPKPVPHSTLTSRFEESEFYTSPLGWLFRIESLRALSGAQSVIDKSSMDIRRIVSRLIDYFNFSNVTRFLLMISIVLGKRSFNGANDRIVRLIVIVGRRWFCVIETNTCTACRVYYPPAFPSHDSPKIIDLSSPIGFYQFISTEDPYNALAYNIIYTTWLIYAPRIFSAICNTRDVIQSMQVIGIIYVWTTSTNDPSFTATATSIRLKWRRDSAKRDAKQVYTAPVANLSVDRNCERNDIVSIRGSREAKRDLIYHFVLEMSYIRSHFDIKIHKRSRSISKRFV